MHMRIKILIAVCLTLGAVSCSKSAVNRSSIESASQGLLQFVQGENVAEEELFYTNAVYFNGKPLSGNAALQALRKDFSGTDTLTLKTQYKGMHNFQQIGIHLAQGKGAPKGAMIIAWAKLAGAWTILFMAKADSQSGADASATLGGYEKLMNRYDIRELVKNEYEKEICFVQGNTTFFGTDAAEKGLKWIANDQSVRFRLTAFENFALGGDYLVNIGDITLSTLPTKYRFIYIWHTVGAQKRLAAEFDYQ